MASAPSGWQGRQALQLMAPVFSGSGDKGLGKMQCERATQHPQLQTCGRGLLEFERKPQVGKTRPAAPKERGINEGRQDPLSGRRAWQAVALWG